MTEKSETRFGFGLTFRRFGFLVSAPQANLGAPHARSKSHDADSLKNYG